MEAMDGLGLFLTGNWPQCIRAGAQKVAQTVLVGKMYSHSCVSYIIILTDSQLLCEECLKIEPGIFIISEENFDFLHSCIENAHWLCYKA